MAVKAQGDVPEGMQRVYRRFERRRSSHRGRLPIPARLWAVAREHGVLQTAKVLRLEYAKLKRMVESAPGSARPAATPATFLELMPSTAVALSQCLIELEGPRGKIRIQWKGATAPDLAAPSRTLWESAADPFSGSLFVFRSRRGTSIRILVYDLC
jgi:hypothetical protein